MATVKLYPPSKSRAATSQSLPQLIQTPSGLALLELQGSINLPSQITSDEPSSEPSFEVGRFKFPDYDASAKDRTAWMQRVHLYVGQHQRLTGEVKKLPKAVAVVRKRGNKVVKGSGGERAEEGGEDLEVVEVVKYKLMFSNRPEPVGTENTL